MSNQFKEWHQTMKTIFNTANDTDVSPNKLLNSLDDLLKSSENITDNEQKSDRFGLSLWCVYEKIFRINCEIGNYRQAKEYLRKCNEFLYKRFPCFNVCKDESLLNDSDRMIRNSFAGILINFYNQICVHKMNNDDIDIDYSRRLINEVETLYKNWNNENHHKAVISFDDLLRLDDDILSLEQIIDNFPKVCHDDNDNRMLDLYLTTMEFAAQIYQKLEMSNESADYCIKSLSIQYRLLNTKYSKVDHIDWALNAATLSQHYAEANQFQLACHMICAARKVLNETDEKIKQNESESYRKAHADLDIIEVKYCLMIFEESKQSENKEIAINNDKKIFPNDDEVRMMENELPKFPIKNEKDATAVYKYAMNAIEKAKQFFTISERCSDHMNCIFDQSSIYGSLISYVNDIDTKCKLNKRRIDLYEQLLAEINPNVFQQYNRKLLYELGDYYSIQVGFKMEQYEKNFQNQFDNLNINDNDKNQDETKSMKFDEQTYKHNVQKINQLAKKSILYFHKFLLTFENELSIPKCDRQTPKTIDELKQIKLPQKITANEQYIKSILTSYMSIGKMFTKIIYTDIEQRKKQWLICQNYYNELKSYLHRNENDCEKYFNQYYDSLIEILELIPIKMQKLQQQQQQQ